MTKVSNNILVFINDQAKDINDLILNENSEVEKIFPNIFSIVVDSKPLDWLIKTYSSQELAENEYNNLMILKDCKNIPKILASGSVKREFNYIILSRAKGIDLYEYVKVNNISENESKKIMKNLLTTVKYIHGKKLIHGDIKIENIIYDYNSNDICLIDFESSKRTLEFMSPEQCGNSNKNVTNKTDIWSCGIVLYCMLSKKCPFTTAKGILTKNPIFPSKFSSKLQDLLSCMLDKNPRIRIIVDDALNHEWFDDDSSITPVSSQEFMN